MPLPDRTQDSGHSLWSVLQLWVDAMPTDTSEARDTKDRLSDELHKSITDIQEGQAEIYNKVSP